MFLALLACVHTHTATAPPADPRDLERPVPDWIAPAGGLELLVGDTVIATHAGGSPPYQPKAQAISARTGEVRWEVALSGETALFAHSLAATDDALIDAEPRSMTALELDDGAVRWHLALPDSYRREVLAVDSPAGPAIAACADRALTLYDPADGSVRAEAGGCERIAAADSALVAVRPTQPDALPWSHPPGPIERVDPATGATLWRAEIAAGSVFVAGDRVLAQEGDEVVALSLDRGRALWRAPIAGEVAWVAAAGDAIAVFCEGVPEPITIDLEHVIPTPERPAMEPPVLAPRDTLYLLGARRGHARAIVSAPGWWGDTLERRPHLAADARQIVWGFAGPPWLDMPRRSYLLQIDARSGELGWQRAIFGAAGSLWLHEGDLLLARPGGLARIPLGAAAPPVSSLAPGAQIDALMGDALGDADAIGSWLAAGAQDYAASLEQILTRWAALPDEQLWMGAPLFEALSGADRAAAATAVAARLPQIEHKWMRQRWAESLVTLGAPVEALLPMLDADDLRGAASRALVQEGSAPALAAVAASADARIAAPYAWDLCGWAECEPDAPDADADGWPDAIEARLGVDPERADTDGDGLDDPADPCPILAAHEADPILQIAWLGLLDLYPDQQIALAGGDLAGACPLGLPGPLLHVPADDREAARERLRAPILALSLPADTGGDAVVEAGLYCGPLCGFGYAISLVRREGRWFYWQIEGTWAS